MLAEVVEHVLVDAAERQRIPGAGTAVVVLGLADLGRCRADGDDRVDDEVARDDVDDGVRRGGHVGQLAAATPDSSKPFQ